MGKQRVKSLKDNQNSSLNRSLSKISLPPLKVQSQKPQWAYQDDYDFLKDKWISIMLMILKKDFHKF
ncbi:hypothetical protein pb186bvf_012643 [Paramecium bursaria]